MTGFGIGNVHSHVPCPFCAAPEFCCYEILDIEKTLSKAWKCRECNRSMKTIFKRDRNGVSFEMYQCGGDDPPAWLLPPMPRTATPEEGEIYVPPKEDYGVIH